MNATERVQLKLLGKGGFARVLQATLPAGRKLAIKLIPYTPAAELSCDDDDDDDDPMDVDLSSTKDSEDAEINSSMEEDAPQQQQQPFAEDEEAVRDEVWMAYALGLFNLPSFYRLVATFPLRLGPPASAPPGAWSSLLQLEPNEAPPARALALVTEAANRGALYSMVRRLTPVAAVHLLFPACFSLTVGQQKAGLELRDLSARNLVVHDASGDPVIQRQCFTWTPLDGKPVVRWQLALTGPTPYTARFVDFAASSMASARFKTEDLIHPGYRGLGWHTSPEVYFDRRDLCDGRDDLYALGLVCFTLFAGRGISAHHVEPLNQWGELIDAVLDFNKAHADLADRFVRDVLLDLSLQHTIFVHQPHVWSAWCAEVTRKKAYHADRYRRLLPVLILHAELGHGWRPPADMGDYAASPLFRILNSSLAEMWWTYHVVDSPLWLDIRRLVQALSATERDFIACLTHWHPSARLAGHALLTHPLFKPLRVSHFSPSSSSVSSVSTSSTLHGAGPASNVSKPEHVTFYEAHERVWPNPHVSAQATLDPAQPLATLLSAMEVEFSKHSQMLPCVHTERELRELVSRMS